MPKSDKTHKWHWTLAFLWAYSLIIMSIFIIGAYTVPINPNPKPITPDQNQTLIIITLPILVFLAIAGYKNFKDN